MNELEKTFDIIAVPCKFGLGATQEIAPAIRKMRAKKVLIVCDQAVNKKTEIPAKVRIIIEEEKVDVRICDEVEPEATMSSIERAIDFLKERENKFDCFVGVGGGSVIAAAKIIALYSSYPTDFYDCLPPPLGKGKPVPGRIKPLIIMPTTAGSGAEASEVAGFFYTDESGNGKVTAIISEYFLPDLAILDPLNTVSMPPQLTASTGLSALLTAIWTYLTKPYHTRIKTSGIHYKGSNPFSDMLAERAIELACKYIRRSYANGYDMEAREGMLFASHLSGLAVMKAGVHIAHAMTMAIAERIKPEWRLVSTGGFPLAVVSPACLDFVAPAMPRRVDKIARLLSEEAEISERKMQLRTSEILKRLLKYLKCPNGLSELGFEEKHIPELTDSALTVQRFLGLSPRLITKEDVEEIFRASLRCW